MGRNHSTLDLASALGALVCWKGSEPSGCSLLRNFSSGQEFVLSLQEDKEAADPWLTWE